VLNHFNRFGSRPPRSALVPLPLTVGRFLVGMVPALVTVIFAGVVALLALLMDKQRRDYALQVADRFYNFVAVLVGARSGHNDVNPKRSNLPPSSEVITVRWLTRRKRRKHVNRK
jgi:hypothetical protein